MENRLSEPQTTLTHLLGGHDTIECAYYLAPAKGRGLDFELLVAEKEALALSKSRHPRALRLGCEEFLLYPNGTRSGFPFLMTNDAYRVQFGEFNKPNFFVTFQSFALWH